MNVNQILRCMKTLSHFMVWWLSSCKNLWYGTCCGMINTTKSHNNFSFFDYICAWHSMLNHPALLPEAPFLLSKKGKPQKNGIFFSCPATKILTPPPSSLEATKFFPGFFFRALKNTLLVFGLPKNNRDLKDKLFWSMKNNKPWLISLLENK